MTDVYILFKDELDPEENTVIERNLEGVTLDRELAISWANKGEGVFDNKYLKYDYRKTKMIE